jgi:hypothetical protein
MKGFPKAHRIFLVLAWIAVIAGAQAPEQKEGDYIVEKPGTITFKHGLVIVGKVERPQVMIFLPKQKSFYREIEFSRSFRADIAEPVEFVPIIK